MKNKDFTLLELLVILATIGLIASIVLVTLSDAKSRRGTQPLPESVIE